MADIFISYKREESEQAARLAHVLEQFGYSVWWDVALLSGEEYRDVIAEMIDKCSAVVVLWSPLAVKSTFVRSEAAYAQRQDKLLPAMLAECHLPLGFDESHMDDLSSWNGEVLHPGLQRLLNSVQTKTGRPAIMGAATPQSASQKAEIIAFQGAAKLNSHGAWAQFLTDHPATIFRDFITVKMSELTPPPVAEPVAEPTPPPIATPAPTPDPQPPADRPADHMADAPEPARIASTTPLDETATQTSGGGAMKTLFVILAVLVISGFGVMLALGAQKQADEKAWNVASQANTAAAYSAYMKDHPKGDFYYTARSRMKKLEDQRIAAEATTLNNLADAAAQESGDWAMAQKLDTFDAYDEYLTAHPEGKHASDARTRQRAIDAAQTRAAQAAEAKRLAAEKAETDRKADDSAWSIAKSGGTTSAYNSYLAAYRSGRHATEARAAIMRLDTPAPYALDQLHPDVRKAVEAARAAEKRAHSRAALARDAAKKADEAAARARAGAEGTRVYNTSTQRFETEYSNGARNGYGIFTVTAGDFVGVAYRGQWSKGGRSGLGIYAFTDNPSNKIEALRYEGDFANDTRNGHGVYTWKSGNTHAGGYSDGLKSGPGVYRYRSGERYEGDFTGNTRNGLGVVWTSSGQVSKAGRWKDDKLVEPMTR